MKPVFYLLLIICIVKLTHAHSGDTCPTDEPITNVCIASQRIVPSINDFALSLYKQAITPTENIVILPIHASLGLLTVCSAARGQTQSEIIAGVRLKDVSCQDAAGTIYDLYRMTPHKNVEDPLLDDVTYQVNRLYVDKTVSLKTDFIQNADRFNRTPAIVDFKNRDAASAEINKWANDHTSGNIQSILTPNDINPDTNLILANAHFLQFFWLMQFDKASTKKGDFKNIDGSTSTVDMMTHRSPLDFFYFDNLKGTLNGVPAFHMAKLFSRWLNAEVLIFLPKDVDGLAALEKGLTMNIITQIAKEAKKKTLKLVMPRFSLETRIEFKSALSGLGIQTLFTPKADFTPMSDTPVMLSSMIHKAMMKVKEEGLQAAAVTVFPVVRRVADNALPFALDRPFMWAIRLTQTNFITYMGRVVKL